MEKDVDRYQYHQLDTGFSNRTFQQVMDLFVLPEVAKRQSNGELPIPFEPKKVLVIFPPDGKEREVRFNEDVHAIAEISLKEGVGKKKGEPIYFHEIQNIEKSKLIEGDDPDSGHILLVNLGPSWWIDFDFRYNKNLSKKHIERATEFIDCAEFSLQRNYLGSFIDNLFSASELLSKSLLMTVPDQKYRGKTSHHIVKNGFNNFVNLGNSRPDYARAINKLYKLRGEGRYLHGEISISQDEAKALLDCVKSMEIEAINSIQN